ncbi:MAG: CPBP family intramembrane metalloprotease [Desulfofustis sp.]|nr:CPBP family intramembrane metalloprotease [Desulfofustis sp.]
MHSFQEMLEKRPLFYSVLIPVLAVGLLFLVKLNGTDEFALFDWPRLLVLNGISIATIFYLYRFGWQQNSGLAQPFNAWHKKWLWATLPMLALGLLNFTAVQWGQLDWSPIRVSAWLASNLSTGIFEEVLMRGFCFYLLLRAWGQTKKGVYLAAIVQALIFGVAHLGNLYHMPALDVIAQVIFATMIGFGFAGLVYMTKSLWPAIIVHSFINGASSMNEYMQPGFEMDGGPGLAGYVFIIVLFFLLATLPGGLYLSNTSLRTV